MINSKVHNHNFTHIYLTFLKGEIKLVDFGFATQLTRSKKIHNSTLGTPLWMAPELINVFIKLLYF